MKKAIISILSVAAGLSLYGLAQADVIGNPNAHTGYVLCNDGVAIAFEITGGGFGVSGAVAECNARHGGVAASISNPRVISATGVRPRSDAVVSATPIGTAVPRATLAQTTEKLNALVATPKFVAMRRARDNRGMVSALSGIGVQFEALPNQIPSCPPPKQWIWGYQIVHSADGLSSALVYRAVCGNDKL